jgi:hypothetical protein
MPLFIKLDKSTKNDYYLLKQVIVDLFIFYPLSACYSERAYYKTFLGTRREKIL